MNKLSKTLIVALSVIPCVGFAQKTVEIDVKKNVHEISKYIYGTNEPYDGATATRWGGNRSSSYNWENNASNGGNDYEFISDNFYDYSGAKIPAYPILNAVKDADSKGQYSLVSLQAVGYVAADKNGMPVTEDEIAPSARWVPISYHKDIEKSPYTLTPNTEDDSVYIDELVNYLTTTLGRAGDGGVSAFAIDNEPFLWSSTHARMHPNQTTPDELIEKTVALSNVIRTLAPGTEIYGPMFFGFSDAYRWSTSTNLTSPEWKNIQKRSRDYYTEKRVRYDWFVDYYLDTLYGVEQKTGIRPVDAIAFHWYPESYGKVTHKRIVNTGRDGVSEAELISADMIEARLQAPRALWDESYSYYGADGGESYVSTNGKAFLSKVKKSIVNFYPGTKIAFTEFEYDAEDHWSGGLCLVDVLGVFGREDVYLACKWNDFQRYSIAAYDLYLNYDGNGSQFGTTSVYATQDDNAVLSSFASIDDNNKLHIIVVNKSEKDQVTSFNIANGYYENGVVYGFGKSSSKIAQVGEIDKIENSTFSYSVPAYSAVHIILNAVPQTKLIRAAVVDENVSEIVLSFDNEVSLVSGADAKQEFMVSVDGVSYEVASVLCPSEKTIKVQLANEIKSTDNNIKVSYLGTNIMGISNMPIASFDTVYVHNEMKDAPMYALSVSVDLTGSCVSIPVSKEIGDFTETGLVLTQDGENVAIKNAEFVSDSQTLLLYPQGRLFKYSKKTISSTSNTVLLAKDGASLADFNFDIDGGASITPKIDSMLIEDNFTIRLYFNSNMEPTTDYSNAGFSISCDGGTIPYTATYSVSRRILTLETTEAMLAGKEYTLNYEDKGLVRTIHYGMLEAFSQVLDNGIEDHGAEVVEVPGTIQGIQYWTCIGTPKVEVCSDNSELNTTGKHLGYISTGDVYTYKISVAEAKNYTVYFRYASESNGAVNFVIDGETYYLSLPSTKSFNKWADAYRVIPLTEGEHEIQLQVEKSGFNIGYLNFVDEENYPVAKITKSRVFNTGDYIMLTFSTNIDVLPSVDEIELIVNDTVNIPVTAIDFNSASVLDILYDTIIYKGATVKLKFASKTIVTADGGSVADAELKVTNASTKIYVKPVEDGIALISDESIKLSPVPAIVNQEILVTVDRDEEVLYTVVTTSGAVVQNGSFSKQMTFTLDKIGEYFVIFTTGSSEVVKKIVVR